MKSMTVYIKNLEVQKCQNLKARLRTYLRETVISINFENRTGELLLNIRSEKSAISHLILVSRRQKSISEHVQTESRGVARIFLWGASDCFYGEMFTSRQIGTYQ